MGNDGDCSPSKGIVILYTICKFTLWKYGVQEPAIPIFKEIQKSLFLYVIFPILKTLSKTITKNYLQAGFSPGLLRTTHEAQREIELF